MRPLVVILVVIILGLKVHAQEKFEPKFAFPFNKGSINYDSCGHGNTCLIFLHGFGASCNDWNDVREYFSPTLYTSYFIDLKGCGFSFNSLEQDYSVKEQSRMLLTFIRMKKLENVVLVGHSFGAAVVLNLLYLDRLEHLNLPIAKLVLIDPAAYFEELPFFFKAVKNPLTRFLSFNLFGPEWSANFVVNAQIYDKKKINAKLLNRFAYFFKLKGFPEALGLAANQVFPNYYDALLKSYNDINIKTLLIWGKYDKVFDVSKGYRLSKQLKNCRFEIVDHCGHVPHEESPLATSELILSFLK